MYKKNYNGLFHRAFIQTAKALNQGIPQKHPTLKRAGPTCNWCQAPENMQLMTMTEKRATGVKKYAISVKGGKKHATVAKRGKAYRRGQGYFAISILILLCFPVSEGITGKKY